MLANFRKMVLNSGYFVDIWQGICNLIEFGSGLLNEHSKRNRMNYLHHFVIFLEYLNYTESSEFWASFKEAFLWPFSHNVSWGWGRRPSCFVSPIFGLSVKFMVYWDTCKWADTNREKKEFWTEAVTFKHSGNSLRLTILLGFRYSNTIHISFFVVLLLGLCALWQWPINHMPEDFGFQRTNNKSVHINKNKKANSQKMFMIRGEKKRKET